MTECGIQIVDINSIAVNGTTKPDKNNYRTVGKDLAKAFEDIGFVYLKNHGIPEKLIKESHEASSKFFNLPDKIKEKYAKISTDEEVNHGYVSINREKLDSGTAPSEIRESYDVKFLEGKFPQDECPELHSMVSQLCDYSMKLFFRLLEAIEFDLDLEFRTLIQCHSQNLPEGGSLMRLLHYPPIPLEVEAGAVRCGTHSDYGTITLLFQDEMGGLEVLDRSGKWQSATPIPGTILVNVGDLLQRWTNDRFVATKHRVLVPKEEVMQRCSRSSIVLFCHPDNDVLVRPLDGSSTYEPITAGRYLAKRYSETYKY